MGVSAFNTELVRFGVDVEKFKPGRYKSEFPVVISLRNLEKIYDIGTLLRAFQIVQAQYSKAQLWILGVGSQKKSLKYLSQILGLKNVTFGGSWSIEGGLISLLKSSWIYVSTALSDAGLASSTAEAMACELPCIVTDVAENAGWVCPYHLFKPGDYKTLAEIIIDLIENPDERELYGELERNLIVEHNNYQVEMAKMETLYTKLLRRNVK